jgi:hypothetical protein
MKISKKIADHHTKAYMDLIDLSNKISEKDEIEIEEFGDIKVGDIYISQKNEYFWIRYIDFSRGHYDWSGHKKISIRLEFLEPNKVWDKAPIVDMIELSSKYEKVNITKKNLYGLSIGDEFKLKNCSVGREAEVVGFLMSEKHLVLTKARMDDFGFPIDKEKDKTWKETINSRKSRKIKTIEKLYLARPKDLEKIKE